jgi:hypothetical protein
MKLQTLLTGAALFFIAPLFGQSSEFDAGDFNVMRIENEIKLSVPNEIADSVWQYLLARYDNETGFLKEIDDKFSTKVAEDLFIDQYYDNKEMELLDRQYGVRHRSRYVLTNTNDRKHGRQLIQIKINDIGGSELNRAEYKYEVKYYGKPDIALDIHPFFNKIIREQRGPIAERLAEYGVDAYSLFPTIRLEQLRKRVYVSYGGVSFATMTLDHVTANFAGKQEYFVELELELNEIGYTLGDSTQRAKMEAINEQIKGDILATFSSIEQDQTPKYNKAFMAMNLVDFSNTSVLGVAEASFSGGALIFMILLTFLYYRWEKKAWKTEETTTT